MSPCPRKGCSMPHLSWSRQEVHALRRHLEALGRKMIGNLGDAVHTLARGRPLVLRLGVESQPLGSMLRLYRGARRRR